MYASLYKASGVTNARLFISLLDALNLERCMITWIIPVRCTCKKRCKKKKNKILKKFGFWITASLVICVILNFIINSACEAVLSGCLRPLLPVDESWLLFLPMIPWPASNASCLPFRSYLSHSFSPDIVSACPDHQSRSEVSVVKEAGLLFTATWNQSKHSGINWKRVHHCVEKSKNVLVYLW